MSEPLILRQRFVWLALLLFVAGGLAASGMPLRIDNTLDVWFVEDDPALQRYEEFKRRYGNDELVVIALHDEKSILQPQYFATVQALVGALEGTEGVERVLAMTNVTDIADRGQGLEVGPLMPFLPEREGHISRMRAYLVDDVFYRRLLVSTDEKTTLVYAWMDLAMPAAPEGMHNNSDERRTEILAKIRSVVAEQCGELKIAPRFAGVGVVYDGLNLEATRQGGLLTGVSYLVILLLLGLMLRRIGATLLAVTALTVSLLALVGLYGVMGRAFNMVTMVLPTLLLVMGVADSVHILGRLADAREKAGEAWPEGLGAAFSAVLRPCLFTSLTTAAGFLALMSSQMRILRDFGLFAGIAMILALVSTAVLVAVAAKADLGVPKRWSRPGPLAKLLEAAAGVATKKPRAVLGASALLAVIAVLGISQLRVDTYSIGFLPEDHAVRQDDAFIAEHFGAYVPLEFTIQAKGGSADTVKDLTLLQKVDAWEQTLLDATDARPPVAERVVSITRVLKRLNRILTDGTHVNYRLPQNQPALEQALLLYEADPDNQRRHVVAEGWREMRVTLAIPMLSAQGIAARIDQALAVADEVGLTAVAVLEPAGYLPLYVTMMDYIVSSQLRSFGLAFLIISALLWLLFRSRRAGLIALPPNLLPALLTLGTMGLLGIPLDVATVTIAAIVIGVAVDDTIHFLHYYREATAAGETPEAAVYSAMRGAGRAMTLTTMILLAGFVVLATASVGSIAMFGVLMCVAVLSALIADLLMLPALLCALQARI